MSVERKEMSENQTLVHLTFRSQGNEDTQSTEAEKECQVRQEKNQEWGVWKSTASKSKSDAPSKAEGRVMLNVSWVDYVALTKAVFLDWWVPKPDQRELQR